MKKIAAFLLTVAAVFTAFFGVKTIVKADETSDDKISTEIFLPTTYLQYYRLENPYAICRRTSGDKEFVAISHKGAIVVYSDEKFYKIDISDLSSEQGIPSLQLSGDYLLFSARSKLYSIYIGEFPQDEQLAYTEVRCDGELVSANDFSVCGNEIAVLTNNDLSYYSITSAESGITLSSKTGALNRNNLSSVLLSKNGATYFYDKSTREISKYESGELSTLVSATEVNAIAESGDVADKKLYYSCAEGVYVIDLTASVPERSLIAQSYPDDEPDKDLGKLWKPQGICLTGKGLWVVDSEIGAVQEIDLTDNTFTDFAITTNSKAVNRLSADAKDVTSDGSSVYALDESRIVVIENAYGDAKDRVYRRVNLGLNADKFAVGGGFVAYSSGKKVYLGKFPQEKDVEITLEPVTLKNSEIEYDVVVDICYKDGVFYVLSNVLSNQKTYPRIYVIDLNAQEKTLSAFYDKTVTEEKANRIAVDVFGAVYTSVCDVSGSTYSFYSISNNKAIKLLEGYAPSGEIIKMQTDFDGKLYLLTSDGKVTCLDSAPTEENPNAYAVKFEKKIEKSAYLENNGVGNPVSVSINENGEKAYFIFGGLILASQHEEQLGISTLNTIPVPEDFSLKFDSATKYGKLKEKSKLFKVDITALGGKYFAYEDYFTQENADDYAFLPISDRFSIAIKSGVAAIVRNSDISESREVAGASGEFYSLVAFKGYTLPVLEEAYTSAFETEKFKKVTVRGEIEFNGVKYVVVGDGENYGYIPASFLTDKLSDVVTVKTTRTAYAFSREGVIVYDENGNPVGRTITGKEKVRVLADGEEYSYVEFTNGSRGYIKTSCITTDSKENFIKCLVAILCASSFLVTGLFLERKYLFET